MADIKDVAAKAGVSIGTVSKVIRGYPSISLKTRENVKAAIKELDYVPNPIALSYASTKSKRVLVYISSLNSDIEDKEKIGSFLEGVFAIKDVHIDVLYGDYVLGEKEEFVARIKEYKPQAIIVFNMRKDDEKLLYLMSLHLYYMVFTDAYFEGDDISYIGIDYTKAQRDVAALIVRRKERILYLTDDKTRYVADLKLAGMIKLAEDYKLDLQLRYLEADEQEIIEAIEREAIPFKKIVAATDYKAISASNIFNKRNVISGFGDLSLAKTVKRSFYTVYVDYKMLGSECLKECLRLIDGGKSKAAYLGYEVINTSK